MEKSDIVIKKLSKKTLSGALEVLDKVFGNNPEDKMQYTRGFNTSLGETKYLHLYPNGKPAYLYYFIAIDKKSNKVVGTTGLYSYPEDDKKGITWLGWYCVDPDFRNKGIGTKLLDFSIQKAKEMKKSKLRIWTVDDFSLKKSFDMYKRRGFKIINLQDKKDDRVYLELKSF